MLPFTTLRELYRIPWIRENREAIHFLSDIFYLLVALFRARRMNEFCWLRVIFFKLIDSFALHDIDEVRAVNEQINRIAWFRSHQRDWLHSIKAYQRVISAISAAESPGTSAERQKDIKQHVWDFAYAFKEVVNFNERDDARVQRLLDNPDVIDSSLRLIAATFY